MESAKTTLVIPIDGWGFDENAIWVRVGLCHIRIPLPNRYISMQPPTLELHLAHPKGPSEQ